MAYVIEFTGSYYHRRKLFYRGLFGVFVSVFVIALLFGAVVRVSSKRPTLRDVLNGPYNDHVNQLSDLNAEWMRLQGTYTNLYPFLRLTSSPHSITNVFASLVTIVESEHFPNYLRPKKWTIQFKDDTGAGKLTKRTDNLSADLLFYAERFNVARIETTRSCLTNLIDEAQVTVSGLEAGKQSGDVRAQYALEAFRPLPMSSVLTEVVEKNRKFRAMIHGRGLGLYQGGRMATLESAFKSSPGDAKKLEAASDRYLDLGTLMGKSLSSTALKTPFVDYTLKEWSKIADARHLWDRRKGQVLLTPESNYVHHAVMQKLVETFPKPSTLTLLGHHFCKQCCSLTNAMYASEFYTLLDDNIYGTRLAPEGLEIPGGTKPSLRVKASSKESADWFPMAFEDGKSNLIAFAPWSFSVSASSGAGMALSDVLDAACALTQSGQGYEIGDLTIEFIKEGRLVQKAMFSGLVPLINPVACGEF